MSVSLARDLEGGIKVEQLSKEEWCKRHLQRLGNNNPSQFAIDAMLEVLENDPWVARMYTRDINKVYEQYKQLAEMEVDDYDDA